MRRSSKGVPTELLIRFFQKNDQDPGRATDDDNSENSTESPLVDLPGPYDSDDDHLDFGGAISDFFTWSPTSSPTSAPTGPDGEGTGGRGGGGGRGGRRGGGGGGGRGGRGGGGGGRDGRDGGGGRGGRRDGDVGKPGKQNLCLAQQTVCQEDEGCAACVEGANMDGTCDATADDCAAVAGYYCCLAGGTSGCSDSDLLLDYISES